MRITVVGLTILAVASLVALGTAADDKDKDKPKHTIKEIMKLAHKKEGGLFGKVTKGEANKDEQQQLLDLYKELARSTPRKGDPEVWKKSTARIVAVAEAVVNGDDKAAKALAKTVNCAACHKEFKGKK